MGDPLPNNQPTRTQLEIHSNESSKVPQDRTSITEVLVSKGWSSVSGITWLGETETLHNLSRKLLIKMILRSIFLVSVDGLAEGTFTET